jgi:TonB family protein
MVFEAYLGDPRSRPTRGRLVGYLASLVIHAPPVTMFMIAWLTRGLVVGNAHDFLTEPHVSLVLPRVPIAMANFLPGSAGQGQGAAPATEGKAGPQPRAGFGGAKRRLRRPLFLPQETPPEQTQEEQAAAAAAVGETEGDDAKSDLGTGSEGPGGTGAGAGEGTGDGNSGGGLAGQGAGAAVVAQKPPQPQPGRASTGSGVGKKGNAKGEGEDGELEIIEGPLPGRPMRISDKAAAYRRVYDNFPRLPEASWFGGKDSYALLVEVYVSEEGEVENVKVLKSASPDVDAFLVAAIRTWRYRPLVVAGETRPFSHPIRLTYLKENTFRRW